MKSAGLWDQFNKVARYQGQDFKLMDKHGKIHLSHIATESEKDRPEIDRNLLRKLLLDSVGGEAVRWDYRLNGVSGPREDGRFELGFEEKRRVWSPIWLWELMVLGRSYESWYQTQSSFAPRTRWLGFALLM